MPKRVYKPVITMREVTSNNPKRKAQARRTITNLMSMGYRGNSNDGSERMYRRGVMRSFGTVRSGYSSNTSASMPRKSKAKSASRPTTRRQPLRRYKNY